MPVPSLYFVLPYSTKILREFCGLAMTEISSGNFFFLCSSSRDALTLNFQLLFVMFALQNAVGI